MSIPRKIFTASKYVINPKSYPFLKRKLKSFLTRKAISLENSTNESLRWCEKNSMNYQDALRKLGFTTNELLDPRKIHPREFHEADNAIKLCPVRMGGGASLELLYTCTQELPAQKVIETGVAYGWSSLAILLANQQHTQLFSTNLHYREFSDENFVGCVVPENLKIRWTLFRGPDNIVLPEVIAQAGEYQLCHYDSDKSYSGRMSSYPILWSKLDVNGLFLSDDIGDNLAFCHFAKMTAHKPVVIKFLSKNSTKYIGAIRKLNNAPLKDWLF